MSERIVKTGLACAGGVVEGAFYEIGALCALEEAIEGLDFTAMDVYVGVSSGALIASALANGIAPRVLSEAARENAEDGLNLRPEVLFRPAIEEYGRRWGRVPKTVIRTIRRWITNPLDLSLFGIATTFGGLVPTGVFDNGPLHRYLARLFSEGGRTNDFRELASKLRVIAIDVDSAEIAAFGEEGLAHVPISKAVQASTALPGLYCPVEIEGRYFIDGVARRTVHASTALREGVSLLFCINPIVPVNLRLDEDAPDRHMVDHGLPQVLSQTFRTLVYSRMHTGFRSYEHLYPDADVVLIEPKMDDYSMFFSNIFSLSNRQDVCERAYASTRNYLREYADELAPKLARHGLRLRRDVLADESRGLYPTKSAHPTIAEQTDAVLDRLDALIRHIGREAA